MSANESQGPVDSDTADMDRADQEQDERDHVFDQPEDIVPPYARQTGGHLPVQQPVDGPASPVRTEGDGRMSVFWNVEHRTARKERRCSDCRRTIRKGERYRRGVGFEGRSLYSEWADCSHCEFVLHQYDLAWDGEYNEDSFVEWAGDGFQDLTEARLQAGYRSRWTTAKGNLWPMPEGVASV